MKHAKLSIAAQRNAEMDALWERLQACPRAHSSDRPLATFGAHMFGVLQACIRGGIVHKPSETMASVRNCVESIEADFYNAAYPMAKYLGWQEDHKGGGFVIMNLREDFEGMPACSTVSVPSLKAAMEARRLREQLKPTVKVTVS